MSMSALPRNRLRTAIGLLLSAYGLWSLIGILGAARHGAAFPSDVFRAGASEFPGWCPILPLLFSRPFVQGGIYLGWMAKAVLVPAGVGTAAGHRPSMRLAIAALVLLAALAVLIGGPTSVALGAGWVSVEWEQWARHFDSPVPAETAERYLRLYGLLALLGVFVTALVDVAIAVCLWRDLVRSRGAATPPARGPV